MMSSNAGRCFSARYATEGLGAKRVTFFSLTKHKVMPLNWEGSKPCNSELKWLCIFAFSNNSPRSPRGLKFVRFAVVLSFIYEKIPTFCLTIVLLLYEYYK